MNTALFRNMLSTLLGAAVAGGLATAALAQPAPPPGPQEPPPGVDAEPLAEDTPILRFHGERELTVQEVQILNSLRPQEDGGILNHHIPMARGEVLEELGRYLAAHDVMAERAREEGLELTDEQRNHIENTSSQYASSLLFEEEIAGQFGEPAEEELHELYEEQKDERFHQQEELRMRHIYVSTYEPYRVEAGDTLESIAREISGEEEKAEYILSDETKRPRHEGLGEEEEEGLPPRALVEGEMLLVPVSGEAEEEARARIDAAYERLEAGEDFRTVAREMSENENPGQLWVIRPAEQERPVMPELMDTFRSLGDREFSEPLRTRHGFQIVYRERYQPEGYRPFEEVRTTLESTYRRDDRARVLTAFYEDLVGDERVVSIDEGLIERSAEEAEPGDILVRIGEDEFTREDITAIDREFMESEECRDLEGFRGFLARTTRFQGPLVVQYMEAEGYKDRPMVHWIGEAMENTFLAESYLNSAVRARLDQTTEDELLAYFEEHSQRYAEPESYELYGIAVPVDEGLEEDEAREAAVTRLTEAVRGIETLEDFKAAADRTNPAGERRFREGGRWGTRRAGQLEDPDLSAIRATNAPGRTEVVFSNNEARTYWVQEAREEHRPPFEEVRERVENNYRAARRDPLREEILHQYKTLAQVEVLPAAEDR